MLRLSGRPLPGYDNLGSAKLTEVSVRQFNGVTRFPVVTCVRALRRPSKGLCRRAFRAALHGWTNLAAAASGVQADDDQVEVLEGGPGPGAPPWLAGGYLATRIQRQLPDTAIRHAWRHCGGHRNPPRPRCIVRLLGAVLPEHNNEWTEANCCMELESSPPAGNNKQHRRG